MKWLLYLRRGVLVGLADKAKYDYAGEDAKFLAVRTKYQSEESEEDDLEYEEEFEDENQDGLEDEDTFDNDDDE